MWCVSFFLLLVLAAYGTLLKSALSGMLPVTSDEFMYFLNARNFTVNSTLKAAFTYTGQGSILLQSDGHGFAYSLLNGSIGKVFGLRPLVMPLTNVALLAFAISVILIRTNLVPTQKIVSSLMILTFMVVPAYTFTFMQEGIHILVSVVATLLLIRIYDTRQTGDIVMFLLVISVASLFRNLWLFWTIGLIPVARNRREFAGYTIVFLISVMLSFTFAKLLWDSFPSYFSRVTSMLAQGDINGALASLAGHTAENLNHYFLGERDQPFPYYPAKILLVLMTLYSAFLFIKSGNRLFLAALLIGCVNFALLFVVFDAWGWREIKSMYPLFILQALLFVACRTFLPVVATLLFLLLSFPAVYGLAGKWIMDHSAQHANYQRNLPALAHYERMAAELDRSENPLVLMGYVPEDGTLDLLFLPLITKSGKPVRYAVNYFNQKLDMSRFDYVLYRPDMNSSLLNLPGCLVTPYFTLVRTRM